MKITSEKRNTIHPFELKDGEMAIITEWIFNQSYLGEIVQRFGEDLIVIGKPSKHSYLNFFNNKKITNQQVRVLTVGTQIEI